MKKFSVVLVAQDFRFASLKNSSDTSIIFSACIIYLMLRTGPVFAISLMVAMKKQRRACKKLSYELEKRPSLVFFVPSLDGGIGRVTALLASGM